MTTCLPCPSPERGKTCRSSWRDRSPGISTRCFARTGSLRWVRTSKPLPRIFAPASRRTGRVLQVVPSGPDVANDPLLDTILMSIFSARQRVWIVTPYFVPDDAVAQALLVACHRGVDVSILVPEKSNHLLADIARSSFLRDIQRAGGTIWQYTPGMLHAKLVIVDDELAMVGSANIDMRSLLLNFEIMQFVYSKAEIGELEAWVCRLVQDSKTGMSAVGAVREIIEGLTRVIEPQL